MNSAAIAWINLVATILETTPLILHALYLRHPPQEPEDEAVRLATERLEQATAAWKATLEAARAAANQAPAPPPAPSDEPTTPAPA